MTMDSFISQLVLVALSLSMNIHPRTEREAMRANCPIMTGIMDRISGTTSLISPSQPRSPIDQLLFYSVVFKKFGLQADPVGLRYSIKTLWDSLTQPRAWEPSQ